VEALLTKTMLLLRLDANGRVLEASPSDLVPVGTLLSDAVLPGDRAAVEAMLQAACRGEPAWGEVTLQRDSTLQRCDAACIPGEFGTSSWLLRPRAPAEDPLLDDEAELERWLGRFLIHEIEIGLLVFDHAALLRYRNAPAVRLLTGQESALPQGIPFAVVEQLLLVQFPASSAVISVIREALLQSRALHQVELERRDGAILELDYLPVRSDEATVAHVLRMRDITVRRRAERRAALAEQRYRDLVELVPVVVYRATAADTAETSYVSPQIERLLGYTPEEWLAERGMWRRHLHPEDRPWITAAIERAVREGREFSLEYRMVRRDGSIVWVQDWGRVRTDESEGTFIHGVMLDITERKEAERARAEVEARLRALVETMPAVLYVCEPEPIRLPDGLLYYPFRYLNDEVAELTGYPASQFLADPTLFARLIHPDDWGRYEAEALRTDATGELFENEFRIIHRDGTIRWVRERAVQLRDATGQPLAWQGLLIDVTAQKETERALREAEERYRTLVEQLPGVVLIRPLYPDKDALHQKNAYLYMSPAIEQLTGFRPEELTPRRYVEQVHPDDRERMWAAVSAADATAAPIDIEYRFIRKDGSVIWLWAISHVIRDAAGRPAYRQVLLMDITARKLAEHALREAEERYRTLVEQLPAVVFLEGAQPIHYPDGRLARPLLYVSPQVEQLTGYRPEEHQQDRTLWVQAIHPEDYPRVRQETREAWATGRFRSEFRILRRDREVRWIESTARLVRDDQGKPLYWQGVMLDVTERKQAERALREAEERYRTLVEQIPAAVIVTSAEPVVLPDGSLHYPVTFLSQRIEEVTGFSREEFLATPGLWFSRMHPDDQPRVFAEAVRTDETGEPFEATYRFQRKDGRWVWLENRAVMVRNAEGKPLFWHGLLIDVTERKRAEELLLAQTTLLRLIAEAAPLSEILELLCHLVEQQAPDLRCSVLLLGSDDRLYHGAAPSLPPRYLAAIDGLPIGPQAGSCGTAAYLDRPIFVEDIASDPRWADYREAALEAGLRACWSTPIRGTSGNVLGTVALYASEPRGPQPNEERLLELATQLAALALERWQESEELRHRAFHDPLTGLPNRLLFLDRLEHAVARADRDGGGIAVLFLDLDDFKRVNDTWGHTVGDAVLQEAAARLSRQVRAGDSVARFAGDEFTVLLDGVTGEHDVRVVTERLLAALASPIRCGEQEIRMGLSIGAAVATGRPMPDSGALLLSADQALYAAKRRGKGCYEIVIAQPGSSQAERRSS